MGCNATPMRASHPRPTPVTELTNVLLEEWQNIPQVTHQK